MSWWPVIRYSLLIILSVCLVFYALHLLTYDRMLESMRIKDRDTAPSEKRNHQIQQTKALLKAIADDEALKKLKTYIDAAIKDMAHVNELLPRIQTAEKIDSRLAGELAVIYVRYERLMHLIRSDDFCLPCAVDYKKHQHWDNKSGRLLNTELRKKNDLGFLVSSRTDQSLVFIYTAAITALPKKQIELSAALFKKTYVQVSEYYRLGFGSREEMLEIIAGFLVDAMQAAEEFQREFKNLLKKP